MNVNELDTTPADAAATADDTPVGATVDAAAWRSTALVVAGYAAFSVVWIFALGHHAFSALANGAYDAPYWSVAFDAWPPIEAARTMLDGDVLAPYRDSRLFVAMPGYAALHLPLAAFTSAFEISQPLFQFSPAEMSRIPGGMAALSSARPSLAPLYGVWALCWSVPFVKVVRTLAWELGVRRRVWVVQAAAVALGYVPMVLIFGHLEDALMVALVAYAIVQCRRGRWTNVALCLMFALSLKQTTALVVPLFFFVVPKEQRVRFCLIVVSLPTLLVVGALLSDFTSTTNALLRPPTFPRHPAGRQAWFLATPERIVDAGPYRVVAVGLAVALAVWLRNNRSMALLTAGVGLAFFARLPFEAVTFFYYLSPVLVFAAIYEARRRGSVAFATGFGIAALTLYWWTASKAWWFWPVEALLLAGATWPLWVDVVRRRFGGDGDDAAVPLDAPAPAEPVRVR